MSPKPRAMILSAGLGSRLRPLTLDLPKALMPIGDASSFEHIARRLRAEGFDSAAVNTHHMRDAFAQVFSRVPIEIREHFEPEILGTAGGIAALRTELEPPIVVHNADIYCRLSFVRIQACALRGMTCLAVAPRPIGEGTVGIRGDRIVRLRGEVFDAETSGGDYLGVAALSEESLWDLPERGCLIGDHCLPRLRESKPVTAFMVEEKWKDIGDIPGYVKCNFDWLVDHVNAVPGVYVASTARIDAGVDVRQSIVGSAASVVGRGGLERCIVWPGASVSAPLKDSIVTHTGRVVPFTSSPEALR